MGQNQRRFLELIDNVCHNEGFAASCDSEERLLVSFGEILD